MLCIAWGIARSINRPLNLIVKEADKIATGDLDVNLDARLFYGELAELYAALLNMMNVIISEGLEDKKFIEERTKNYEELKELVSKYTPEKVEEITQVPAETIRDIAIKYAKADKAAIVYSLGITEHSHGVDNVMQTANLAMLTGNIGRLGTGVNPLRGQNNVQGACDMGALPTDYPGYRKVIDKEIMEDVTCKKGFESWSKA